jgi:hypothetical protein
VVRGASGPWGQSAYVGPVGNLSRRAVRALWALAGPVSDKGSQGLFAGPVRNLSANLCGDSEELRRRLDSDGVPLRATETAAPLCATEGY